MPRQPHSMTVKTSFGDHERPGRQALRRAKKSFLAFAASLLLSLIATAGTSAQAAPQEGSDYLYVCNSSNIGRTDNITAASPDWVDITPPGVGTIRDCIPDPWQPEEKMWVVSSAGIWKGEQLDTTAATWTLLVSTDEIRSATDGHTQNGADADRIIPSRSIPGTVFVLYSHGGLGGTANTWLARSIDDGSTWTWRLVANEGEQARPYGFAITDNPDSSAQAIVWATTRKGHLFKSTDAGETFQRVLSLPESAFYQLHAIYSPVFGNDGSILYVGGGSSSRAGAYVSRTVDGGTTWTDISPVGLDSLPRGPFDPYEITGTVWSPFQLYALVQRPHDVVHENKKLYFSTDGGSSWSLRYDFASWGFDVVGIGTNAYDENRLYVLREGLQSSATEVLFGSDDGGATWTNKSGNWKANIGNWTLPIAVWDGSYGPLDRVTQGSDDAGPRAVDCSFSVGHPEIYIGECASGEEIVSGFRFPNIPISSPDEIQSAYIRFTVDGPYSNDIRVAFRGEDVDNSETFSDTTRPSDRAPLTGHLVEWHLDPSDVWQVGETRNSPDLSPILREIVGRPGWSIGNAISIIVTNVASSGNHRRVFAVEREGATKAARLVINKAQPFASILSPRDGDRWFVEEVHDIRWSTYALTDIRIEFSRNNGVDWEEIVSPWPAGSGSYSWEIPNLTSSECKVRISSVSDPNLSAESGVFTIKGWQLSRLVNGKYELFDLSKHAWSFGNSDQDTYDCPPYPPGAPWNGPHMDKIMWPYCWWRQFDYTAYPYNTWPWKFTEPWINAKPANFPDWPLFVKAYGEDQCYFEPPPGTVIYEPSALLAWTAIREGLKGGWQGSCAGFAISCFADFDDRELLLEKFPELGQYTSLHDVSLDSTIRKVINRLWIHQFGLNHVLDFRLRFKRTVTPLETLNQLKEMFLSDQMKDSYLVMWASGDAAIHAVNPYKIERDPSDPNRWLIYVYDNNAPNDATRKIWVLEANGRWLWAYPPQGWIRDKGLHLMGPAVDLLQRPLLPKGYFVSTTNISRHRWVSEKEETATDDYVVVYNNPMAPITIEDADGRTVGFKDSVEFSNFDDALPIIPITSVAQPPLGYLLPKGEYEIQIHSIEDSLVYFAAFDSSTVYYYRRGGALSGQTDRLTYGKGGVAVKNEDVQRKEFSMQSILAESDHEKVFQIDNCEMAENDSIHVDNVHRMDLQVANLGSAKQYDLTVELASAEGMVIFEHPNVPLAPNTSHTVLPDWQDLANHPIQILVDNDLDGAIDDTMSVDNEAVPVEGSGAPEVPESYVLAQNYPNPFNATTKIEFGLPRGSAVRIELYNLRGQRVAVLHDAWEPAGYHTVTFDAGALASGLYIYRMKAGAFSDVRKMLVIK